MLFCIFVISVGAVTTYDDAPQRTQIQVSTDDVVVFDDGFCCPTGYVFKDLNQISSGGWNDPALPKCFDFSYINEKTKKAYEFKNIVELDLPQGLTYMGGYLGRNITTLKRISIPDSVKTFGTAMFQDFVGLEYCVFEHKEDSDFKTFPSFTFLGCTQLKSFSMPDSVTRIDGVAQFSRCSNLEAVYLSKNLTEWACGSQNNATFDGCKKLYFVSEPFALGEIPEKVTTYYFPKGLKELPNQCVFRYCESLNDILVFGETFTSIPSEWTFQSSPKNTVVFLGDMVNINAKSWGTQTIVFANKNDKSSSDIATLLGTQKKIYCNAEGNTEHLAEKTVFEEAKCEINAGNATYCFCGYQISKDDIEGTALSHDHDYVNGKATLISINYADISKDGTKTIKCGLCNKDGEVTANKLFDYKGYSKKESGKSSICVGYAIDYDALAEYEELADVDYIYGFVASANNNTPLDENANAGKNVIKTDLTDCKFTSVEFILSAKDWTAVSEVKLSINMYIIIDGAVKYITGDGLSETAEAKTYLEI